MIGRVPSEAVIAAEMRETGLDWLPAIRRLQQQAAILRQHRDARRREVRP